MTLHEDQLALAETQHPGRFFEHVTEPYCAAGRQSEATRVLRVTGVPVTVCLEPKRDEFMKHYLAQLATK